VNAIVSQPDFVDTSTSWNFYLVTSEYDRVVRERVTQAQRPVGLFIEKSNHKVWVKTWAQLVRECESRLDFIQSKLQIEVSNEEISKRIEQLKSSILKFDAEGPPGAIVAPGATPAIADLFTGLSR
jgi:hypothetical protein